MIERDDFTLCDVGWTEETEAHGDGHFRAPHVQTPLEALIGAEEQEDEDRCRARQEIFRRLVEFFLDGTKMKPDRIAMRVLVVVKAVAPDLLSTENQTGSVETSMRDIGDALGRTKAAVCYNVRKVSDFASQRLEKPVVFTCQRTEDNRENNRRAALGNDSRRKGLKRLSAVPAASKSGD